MNNHSIKGKESLAKKPTLNRYDADTYEVKFVSIDNYYKNLPPSAYDNYNAFMASHGAIGGFLGVSSLPGTAKTIVDISQGELLQTAAEYNAIAFARSSDWGNVITTAKVQSSTLISSSIKGAIGSTFKSSLIWGAPLSLAGDFLECGIDSYHSKRNGICATPEKFKANVSLNAVKAVGSGVAAGAGGYVVGGGMSLLLSGGAIGAYAGPIGAAAGFSTALIINYFAGNAIESSYKYFNVRP